MTSLAATLFLTAPAQALAAPNILSSAFAKTDLQPLAQSNPVALTSTDYMASVDSAASIERIASYQDLSSVLVGDNSQWIVTLGLLLAGGVLSWGVLQYSRQQQWQRIELLRQAVREFEQDPDTHNALKILDFEEYRDYQIMDPATGKPFFFRITEDLLCNALANHDARARIKHQLDEAQQHGTLKYQSSNTGLAQGTSELTALRQYQIETALRDWFNKMLNGLEHFGYFVESGLCTEKELAPWLRYWVKLIGDPAYRRPGASRFYDALYSYIHHSGFFGVQKLFERFGYRILPSPYKDDDLAALDRSSKCLASGQSVVGCDTHIALTLAKAAYLAYQDKQFVAEVVDRWGTRLNQLTETTAGQPIPIQSIQKTRGQNVIQSGHQRRSHLTKNSFIRHNFRYFNNKGRDTQAYMFRTENFMVLAFRGSQEPKDWLTNVTTQLRNFTIRKDGVTSLSSYKGRVHTGFFLAWAIIEKSVLAQIHRWQKDSIANGKTLPPLYITGHSLGGALATMAAAALSDNGIEVAGVYTFGQPRVGDRTFAQQLNQHTNGKVFRFVNNNDIVPHVPPPFSIWNPTRFYGHVGMAKYFDAGGNIRANYTLANRLISRAVGVVKGVLGAGFDLISDHNMEYYISHLDTALKEEAEDKAAQMLDIG
ncbi:MAG: lipase family protein [Cyanobacteria bacterium J06573_11]